MASGVAEAEQGISQHLRDDDYESALRLLANLRAPLDAFFDKVTVNAPEPDLRQNRLRLLHKVRSTMDRIADFSQNRRLIEFAMTKWVYSFGAGHNEGGADMRNLLGGKGANLAEMASIGLPVPPGFTTHHRGLHRVLPEPAQVPGRSERRRSHEALDQLRKGGRR